MKRSFSAADNFWRILYNIIILPALYSVLFIASLFVKKIRKGLNGRETLFTAVEEKLAGLPAHKNRVWVHASSMGEFEQAKPVIEQLKKTFDVCITATFFSPSGYDNSLKYPHADIISYIPFDSISNAGKFISLINPTLVIIMRYDIWPNHIWELWRRNIPVYLIDATMKEQSARKYPLIKSFHKLLYNKFSGFMAISGSDGEGFREFGIAEKDLSVVGDTRFDRVYLKSIDAKGKKILRPEVIENKKVFVAGSAWGEDEEVLLPALKKLLKYEKNLLVFMVPHEPTIRHLEQLEQELAGYNTIRFSLLNNYNDEQFIIIDSIGILLTLYSYAHTAFIGGSFKSNIHNVLEAAVYGIPVVYGPKIHGSREAGTLASIGGGFIVNDKKQMYRILRTLFSDETKRLEAGNISREYVSSNIGATEKILGRISHHLVN